MSVLLIHVLINRASPFNGLTIPRKPLHIELGSRGNFPTTVDALRRLGIYEAIIVFQKGAIDFSTFRAHVLTIARALTDNKMSLNIGGKVTANCWDDLRSGKLSLEGFEGDAEGFVKSLFDFCKEINDCFEQE